MTVEQVQESIHSQSAGHLSATNDHGISLKQALVPPWTILVISRLVTNGQVQDQVLSMWLVGQEPSGGYRIIMSDDGSEFGLAASGVPGDAHLVLVGWYGDLVSAFLGM